MEHPLVGPHDERDGGARRVCAKSAQKIDQIGAPDGTAHLKQHDARLRMHEALGALPKIGRLHRILEPDGRFERRGYPMRGEEVLHIIEEEARPAAIALASELVGVEDGPITLQLKDVFRGSTARRGRRTEDRDGDGLIGLWHRAASGPTDEPVPVIRRRIEQHGAIQVGHIQLGKRVIRRLPQRVRERRQLLPLAEDRDAVGSVWLRATHKIAQRSLHELLGQRTERRPRRCVHGSHCRLAFRKRFMS